MPRDVDQTVRRPFGRIHFAKTGHQGPRVLFIMGLGMRGAAWERQVDALAPDHQLVTFDNRGMGQSDASRGWFRVEDMADDACAVLDHLNWSTAHVVAVSMGGMVAQHLAARHPHRLTSLTLIATAAGPSWRFLNLKGAARGFLRGLLDREYTGEHRTLYSDGFLLMTDRADLDARRARVSEHRTTRRLRQFGAVLRHDARPHLAHVQMPTLVISPTADRLIRADACRDLAARLENATLHEVEESGHGVVYEAPDAVNDALRRHIAQCDAPRTTG